jgi:hypothetical protein
LRAPTKQNDWHYIKEKRMAFASHPQTALLTERKQMPQPNIVSSLFFPLWKSCPYKFNVRLVWAALMDLTRKELKRQHSKPKPITPTAIKALTGLARDTIRQAIATLEKDGLCKTDRTQDEVHNLKLKHKIRMAHGRTLAIVLIEPKPEQCCWYPRRVKNGTADHWLNRIAYCLVEFDPERTAIENVLRARLRRLLTYKVEWLAEEALGVSRQSVINALKALTTASVNNSVNNGEVPKCRSNPVESAERHLGATERELGATERHLGATEREMGTSIKVLDLSIKALDEKCFATQVEAVYDGGTAPFTTEFDPLTEAEQKELEDYERRMEQSKDQKNRAFLNRAGCKPDYLNYVLKLWQKYLDTNKHVAEYTYGHLALHYTEGYLADKAARNPVGFIVAHLRERLGIEQRKEPVKHKSALQSALEKTWFHRSWQEEELVSAHHGRMEMKQKEKEIRDLELPEIITRH